MASLKTLLGLSFFVPYVFGQDHTQCVDSGSDWYTSVVGETPCRTYERLRQLCNSEYVVGTLNPNTPPDTCDDQIADCCCNSIAFGLSMFCLTCQQGIGSSGNGIDAGIGAYQQYLKHGSNSFCSPNTNSSFTNDIQTAVCNNNLRIHDNFYNGIFWSDGSWFYTWSRERMEETDAANGNNSFTHCASTAVILTSSSQSPLSMSALASTQVSQPPSSSISPPTLLSQSTSTPLPLSRSLFQSTSISLSQSVSLLRSQSTSLSQSNITSRTESTDTSATSSSTLSHSSNSLTAGAIAGIVVGSIAFVGAITLFFLWLCSYRRRQTDVEGSETSPTPFTISDDGNTPYMSNSAGIPMLTGNPESGAWRRLRMKEQREPPPRYTE